MINYLVQRFLWFRERGFVQITQKTLVSLFPFFLFSGIIRVISLSVFSELGSLRQKYWYSWCDLPFGQFDNRIARVVNVSHKRWRFDTYQFTSFD